MSSVVSHPPVRSWTLKEVIFLPGIAIREGESFEQALRRFKKQCEKAGILSELRKREHFEKPSIARMKKAEQAKKRGTKSFKSRGNRY